MIFANTCKVEWKPLFLGVLVVFCLAVFTSNGQSMQVKKDGFVFSTHSDYWPTNGWRYTSPEKQGVLHEEIEKFNATPYW